MKNFAVKPQVRFSCELLILASWSCLFVCLHRLKAKSAYCTRSHTCCTIELALPYASPAWVVRRPASVPNTRPANANPGITDSMTSVSFQLLQNAARQFSSFPVMAILYNYQTLTSACPEGFVQVPCKGFRVWCTDCRAQCHALLILILPSACMHGLNKIM